jgi:hypothetical protein
MFEIKGNSLISVRNELDSTVPIDKKRVSLDLDLIREGHGEIYTN